MPYYYSVAVNAESSSLNLLKSINQFIAEYHKTPERNALEEKWQGATLTHTVNYQDEPGDLIGEAELENRTRRTPLNLAS